MADVDHDFLRIKILLWFYEDKPRKENRSFLIAYWYARNFLSCSYNHEAMKGFIT